MITASTINTGLVCSLLVFSSISRTEPNLEIQVDFVHIHKKLCLPQTACSIDWYERKGMEKQGICPRYIDKEHETLRNTVTWDVQKSHLKTIHLEKFTAMEEPTIQRKNDTKHHQKQLALDMPRVATFRYFHPSILWILLLRCYWEETQGSRPTSVVGTTPRCVQRDSSTARSGSHEHTDRFKVPPPGCSRSDLPDMNRETSFEWQTKADSQPESSCTPPHKLSHLILLQTHTFNYRALHLHLQNKAAALYPCCLF